MEDLAAAVDNQTQIIQMVELVHLDKETTADMVVLLRKTLLLVVVVVVLVLLETMLRLILHKLEVMVVLDQPTQLLAHP
jgi:hypothetical protein